METERNEQWTNWSGSLTFEPDEIAKPEDEEELLELIARCHEGNRTVRTVGRGHSSTPILETDDVLVSLENMTGVVSHDAEENEATVRAGTPVGQVGKELHDVHLGMRNYGDISLQRIGGAVGTGTHGAGPEITNLSGMVVGGRMVTATGEIREFDESDPELLKAARLSMGTLGIFTELRLDVIPTYKVQRREYCTNVEDFFDHVDDLVRENRHFDFYWYPRSDEVKIRLLNPPGGGSSEANLEYASLVKKETDWSHEIIPEHDELERRYDEMEYAIPADAAKECFLDVRERIRENWRADVGWRVLWRTVAEDDTFLSPAYDRETVTISLLQNAELDFWDYFEDIEPIFLSYGGRPHWGKKHTLRAPELEERYPKWERFREIRREMDPDGVFMSDYLTALLEGEADS
ncbi:MAG: FAD-binding protein [Euryarchaeota archaeon]|nr:FAD-binding protein [Euryarchaeota archaeon]